jgi:hypothetical protein
MLPIEQHGESTAVMDGDNLSMQETGLSKLARRGEDIGAVKGNGDSNPRLILSFGSHLGRGSKAAGKEDRD